MITVLFLRQQGAAGTVSGPSARGGGSVFGLVTREPRSRPRDLGQVGRRGTANLLAVIRARVFLCDKLFLEHESLQRFFFTVAFFRAQVKFNIVYRVKNGLGDFRACANRYPDKQRSLFSPGTYYPYLKSTLWFLKGSIFLI